jgi:LmbE family N-acetylglucosaminyl deacetylase
MNVLAIGAHFDDIELGCGGTLARHVRQGDQVVAFVATQSGYSNPNNKTVRSNRTAYQEGVAAMKKIGARLFYGNFRTFHVEFGEPLNRKILALVEGAKIERMYTHWENDAHHDHKAVSQSSLHCAKHVAQVLMYRSNWYKTPVPFKGNFYSDISEVWPIKEAAIKAHRSEMKRVGRRWLTYFKNEAKNAGMVSGVQYAEAFEVVKWTEK